MSDDKTTVVNTSEINYENIKETLKEICLDLEERGYSPEKQIVAYLVSGDPGFISSYKECRSRIQTFKREDALGLMLKDFLNK